MTETLLDNAPDQAPLRIYLIAGEESGDQLGARLMIALKERLGSGGVAFTGIGGGRMIAQGLASLFPMSEIAVNGLGAVIANLPGLVARVYRAVDAVVAEKPDILVIIDSPEFTHAVASRVRRRAPTIPIVNYPPPTVWAWRPGRARKMLAYVDHSLALKPFEPDAHRRLGGPPCSYVGHPLIERLSDLRPGSGERAPVGTGPLDLVVLPGSRRSEIRRLMEPFGAAIGLLAQRHSAPVSVTLPAVAHLADEIAERARSWPVAPRIVHGEAEKFAAFRRAQVALAASGTVTLELALAGVPQVVAYRVSRLEEPLRHLIKVPSIVLANLVIGDNVIPEFIQADCTAEKLASALADLSRPSPERQRQESAFASLDSLMAVGDETPSGRAARLVLETLARKREHAIPGTGTPSPS